MSKKKKNKDLQNKLVKSKIKMLDQALEKFNPILKGYSWKKVDIALRNLRFFRKENCKRY